MRPEVSEVKEGPSRRVSKGRKRSLLGHKEGKTSTEQSGRCLKSSLHSKEVDWFSNCFQSSTGRVTSQLKPPARNLASITPKAKRSRKLSEEADAVNIVC